MPCSRVTPHVILRCVPAPPPPGSPSRRHQGACAAAACPSARAPPTLPSSTVGPIDGIREGLRVGIRQDCPIAERGAGYPERDSEAYQMDRLLECSFTIFSKNLSTRIFLESLLELLLCQLVSKPNPP